MTGLSLGFRSASYGSLPMPNGSSLGNQHSPPLPGRKQQKMSLTGSREKERGLPWIFKIVSRRKVGILILVLVSVAVLSFLSLIFKAEDTSTNSDSSLGFTNHVRNFVNSGRSQLNHFAPPFVPEEEKNFEGSINSNQQSPVTDNITESIIMALPPSITFTHHPCESFSLPPPPADKKRTGPRPCPVCYVPVEQALGLMPRLPSASPVLKDLNYFQEENLIANDTNGGSIFGGHPSLQQRAESFDIKESMTVHCGFVKGKRPGQGTGFDIYENDLLEMEKCRGAVVASAIFGNYDIIQQPKNISEYAQKNACFYMFVDEETEAYLKNSSTLDDTKRVGLWRVVVVRNLPYTDARRNGKVPKLLVHRLFPNARYSLWIDGKLELVVDPYQIFERFLWRSNSTFAISRHYRRFDVFEEAEANKAAGKYDNASIDRQIEFYKNEGLTHYSSEKLPITSDVPEGCVIIKEHTPISNLFTCLWFNEVDRFTSRDQISFSTVRDKIMSRVNWTVNMFMDCERRNFVVQAYHRDVLNQKNALAALSNLAPPTVVNTIHPPAVILAPAEIHAPPVLPRAPPIKIPGKVSMRRGKERRRHRRSGTGKDNISF